MKIQGYLHIALMNGLDGIAVASEIHGRILQSGIYDKTDVINVGVLFENKEHAEFLYNYILKRYPKYRLRYVSPFLDQWEWQTLRMLHGDCSASNDLRYVWYAHSKGVSNCVAHVSDYIQSNIRDWRGVMCRHLFDYEKAIGLLDSGYTAVGPFLVEDGNSNRHFSGNFWWATSKHISGLVIPQNQQRNDAEGWICSGHGVLGNMLSSGQLGDGKIVDLYDFQGQYAPAGPFRGLPGASR